MNQTGWEIRPIGLVILIAIAGIVVYFIYKEKKDFLKRLLG